MPWLTPDNPPDNQSVVRRIVLPADVKWTAIFDGMLLDLCYRRNWEAEGTMEPQAMADWWWSHYNEFTTDFKETPYSDGPADLDGEPTAPWYENLYDWVIAGFLAFTFTPGAAIVYQATVPKLRLAFRTGDIGALFKVLINGVEVWTGDSYGPLVDVIEQVFDTSTLSTPYTVRIEHNGSGEHGFTGPSKLEYIRQEAVAEMVQTILRADPAGCGVQWSLDNGGSWETIDLAECIDGIAKDAITNAIQDGTIAPPVSQPGPTPSPDPGDCKTWHVTLQANQQFILPAAVYEANSIRITNAKGGWCDGAVTWNCPDGNAYGLGMCTPDTGHHEETDPLNPGANHMQIVGLIVGEDVWFNAMDSAYVVPSGISGANVVFQANDSTLSDNLGSVEFDVELCATAADWCYRVVLTETSWIWAPITSGGNTYAGWAEGVGWSGGDFGANDHELRMQATLATAGHFTRVRLTFQEDINPIRDVQLFNFAVNDTLAAGNVWDGVMDVTTDNMRMDFTSVSTGQVILKVAEFWGMGDNPFGPSNC